MKIVTSTLLIAMSTLFIACGENTTTPIVSDVNSLKIEAYSSKIYSTDTPSAISATVTYLDGTPIDATLDIKWRTDIDTLYYENGTIWGGLNNGGTSSLTAIHSDFNDSVEVEVYSLSSFYISSDEITTTGEHILSAKGNFEDNASHRDIVKNIVWSADNDAVITVEDDVVNNVYPMPRYAEGKDDVFVGRIRRDESREKALNMWIVSDNLRKGAATNAIQIAESMIERGLIKG